MVALRVTEIKVLTVGKVSQRGVVFFRDQTLKIDEQKVLGQKLGELSGKPSSSTVRVFTSGSGKYHSD